MMKLLSSELYKLLHDAQLRICIVIMLAFSGFSFLLSVNPELYQTTDASVFLSYNLDPAILLLFTGFTSLAVFASEYSCRTYKNIVPFFGRGKIFLTKTIAMVVLIAVTLLLNTIVSVATACMVTGDTITLSDVQNLLFQYIVFFAMSLLLSSMLTLFGLLVQNRALGYVAAIMLSMTFSVIPVPFTGDSLWYMWATSFEWGQVPSGTVVVITLVAAAAIQFVGGMMFERKELRV